jgi:hypothetical protein
MTKTFLEGAYRAHQQKTLLDEERARLPETQGDAALYIHSKALVDEIQPSIDALEAQILELSCVKEREVLKKAYWDFTKSVEERREIRERYKEVEAVCDLETMPFTEQINSLQSEVYWIAVRNVENYGLDAVNPTFEKKWTFVGKCVKPACEGFIGTDYVCGLCKVHVCEDCMEPSEGTHICNADNVLTVKALRKEAKPCPKCAAMISKIDGCDQMWCVVCRTAFSWRSGSIETVVHNPHFFEWMRRTGHHIAPGPVNVGNPACAFQTIWTVFVNTIQAAFPKCVSNRHVHGPYATRMDPTIAPLDERYDVEQLYEIARTIPHVHAELGHIHREIQADEQMLPEKKRVLRVRRLAGEITNTEWKKSLEQFQRQSKYNTVCRDIYETYIHAAMALMEGCKEASLRIEIPQLFKHYEELVNYTNDSLRTVRSRFNISVQYIPTFKA